MADVTQILSQIEQGDRSAAEQLLPLVYDELRRLAGHRMSSERPGDTLQATALVHEAYVRLVDVAKAQSWESRGHFFAAAAESMRRILIDRARKRASVKHGGALNKVDLDSADLATAASPDALLLIDEAIDRLKLDQPLAAKLVSLRYFAGLSIDDAADAIGISKRSAYRHWTYARAWLFKELLSDDQN
jgi:RNA polymerase sigma factor (TIGR02999 family)